MTRKPESLSRQRRLTTHLDHLILFVSPIPQQVDTVLFLEEHTMSAEAIKPLFST